MGILNLIAAIGLFVFALGGWWAHDWVDHHADLDFTWPIPIRWVLPADAKHVHLVGATVERDKALAEATRADAALAKIRAQTAVLQASLAAQNAAVEAVARESAQRIAASQKAALEARKVALRLREHASEILALQRPAATTACEAADALILKEAQR